MHKNRDSNSWEEFFARAGTTPWQSGPVVVAGENIVPHYQPIVSLTSGRIVGYECLARSLNSKGLGRSFGHFFNNPKVNSSYQLEVDRSLRYQALKYFADHPDAGYITLNISPIWIEKILSSSSLPTLEMIKETGIDPRRVVIEITETKGDLDCLREIVDLYHEAGLMVAVDDFGAGASQIDRVEALQPDIVKLDMRLFKQASRGGRSADIALSIAGIANRVGCHIVCEGVETEEEFHFGIECGSNHIQGHIFHKALAETIEAGSTVEKVRALQKSYLREKTSRLIRTARQKENIREIVFEIRDNYLVGEPLASDDSIVNSDVFRYYICDSSGNQLTANFEKSADGFFEEMKWQGMNWSHRPYFPIFIASTHSGELDFTASDVYRDVRTHQLCRTYAVHLDENRMLLVDALVEDEIIFVKDY